MNTDRAQLDYLRWLSGHAPALFERLKPRFKSSLGDLGWIQAIVQVVAAVGSAVMAKNQQKKQEKAQKKAQAEMNAESARVAKELADTLVQVNTQRAQRGLPPVDAQGNVIASAALPMPGALANFFGPQGQVIGSSFNPMWILAGAGALVAVVLIARR